MNCLLSPSFCCSSGQFICVYDCQEYVFLALLCPMFAIRICLLVSVKCEFFQPFPFHLYHLLEQSLPFYDLLKRESKKIPSSMKPSLPLPSLPVAANEKLLAWVGNELLPRNSAKVTIMWFWDNFCYVVWVLVLCIANFCPHLLFIAYFHVQLKVSVFDSVVQGGDAVWEGLRVYDGKIFKLSEHLDRLPIFYLFLFIWNLIAV